jgi:transposase
MLRGGDVRDILQMRQDGLSVRQISKLTGLDRKTVRKYELDPQIPQYGPRQQRPSKLSPFEAYIEQRLKEGVWNTVVLLRELCERGYMGGYTILRSYVAPRRQQAYAAAVRRFETAPGQQAQVDWGSVGSVQTEDSRRSLSAFVITLGHSRALFADICQDERLPNFLRMHEEAFFQLGGVPKEILYDRLKTALTGADERGELIWNPTFLDFARYWGFVPRVCQGYRPQTKGKVESGVKYLKGNFLCGRSASSVEDLRMQLKVWLAEVANQRVHGTTHRVIALAHEEEKPYLHPIGSHRAFPLPEELFEKRRVARDCYISYHSNRYSVPSEAVGKDVVVQERSGKLEVTLGLRRLAEHTLCDEKHRVITVAAHLAGIELGAGGRSQQKNQVHIPSVAKGGSVPSDSAGSASAVGAPDVQTRDLGQYEAIAQSSMAQSSVAQSSVAQSSVAQSSVAQATEVNYA